MTTVTDADGTASYLILPPQYPTMTLVREGKNLLQITAKGEVIAPDLEAASEAGRVFVESIKGQVEAIRQAAILEGMEIGLSAAISRLDAADVKAALRNLNTPAGRAAILAAHTRAKDQRATHPEISASA